MADSLIRMNIITGDTIRNSFTAGIKESIKSRFSIVRHRMPTNYNYFKEMFFSGVTGTILTGTHSNVIALSDSTKDSIFVADAENIYCFDNNLKERWITPLPLQGLKSVITKVGSRIFLQNFGVAFQNALIGRCGEPFIASYDARTGRQLSFTKPDLKKKGCRRYVY